MRRSRELRILRILKLLSELTQKIEKINILQVFLYNMNNTGIPVKWFSSGLQFSNLKNEFFSSRPESIQRNLALTSNVVNRVIIFFQVV